MATSQPFSSVSLKTMTDEMAMEAAMYNNNCRALLALAAKYPLR